MFKKGDKYIHFTRFGGTNTGEVDEYFEVENIDTQLQMCYFIPHIRSTKKIVLQLDGKDGMVYRLDETKDADFWLKLFNTINKSQGMKKHVEAEHMLKTGIRTFIR